MNITLKIIKLLLFLPITSLWLLLSIIYVLYKFFNSFHPKNFIKIVIPAPLDEMVYGNPNGEFFVRILLVFIISFQESIAMIKEFDYEF